MTDISQHAGSEQQIDLVATDMRRFLQQVATGPELSKDLTLDEARTAMEYILEGRADEVQAAVFLIALRMKRETLDELLGVLQALLGRTKHIEVDLPDLVDLADPFDGYQRGMPIAPFLPPVLAACGIPAVSNGVESLGPKFGITASRVLAAACCSVNLTTQAAADQLTDPDIGWAYVDQRESCPDLHRLLELRRRIVKRPCLTTVEVLVGPLRAVRTHLMTGYVHKPYPPIYTALARAAGYASAMVVRGVEGGVIPSLNQASKYFSYHGDSKDREFRLDPGAAGIQSATRTAPWPEIETLSTTADSDKAQACAEQGIRALSGEAGPFREGLVYGTALCLMHLGRAADLMSARAAVSEVLDSGAALARFERVVARRRSPVLSDG